MKWDFLYDEEIFDDAPNFMGIITNGKDVLFYHSYYPEGTHSNTATCEIYSSFTAMFIGGEAVVRFPWSAENDEKLINFLNSLPEDADVISDESVLLNFNPDEYE